MTAASIPETGYLAPPDRAQAGPGSASASTRREAKRYDPDRLKVKLGVFEQKKREALARWGLLKDYDRMKERT